jgi:hypothetical protein
LIGTNFTLVLLRSLGGKRKTREVVQHFTGRVQRLGSLWVELCDGAALPLVISSSHFQFFDSTQHFSLPTRPSAKNMVGMHSHAESEITIIGVIFMAMLCLLQTRVDAPRPAVTRPR